MVINAGEAGISRSSDLSGSHNFGKAIAVRQILLGQLPQAVIPLHDVFLPRFLGQNAERSEG